MKKFFLSIIVLIIIISSVSVYGIGYMEEEISEDNKMLIAMLMNQVQYSVSNIIQNKNKEILTQEFDSVINEIDKAKLIDDTTIRAFTDLLDTLKELKLSDAERDFFIEKSEIERKQACVKAFTNSGINIGTAIMGGSIITKMGKTMSPHMAIVSLLATLAYTGISAGLNIANAKNEVDNKLKEELFRLNQKDCEKIDAMRIKLFKSYAEEIKTYKIPTNYEIIEQEMKDFIKQINGNKNPKDLITVLKNKNKKFENFPMFWFQLGYQYQLEGKYNEAIKCYDKFEILKKKYSYIKYDSYYIAVAKNKIQILKKNISVNSKEIHKYLKIIEENLIPKNESENRLFMASIYFELGESEKAKELLELNIARKEDSYSVSCDMLALIEYERYKKSNSLNPAVLFELSNIDITKDKNLTLLIPKKFALGKFAYINFDKKIYPNPYMINVSSGDFCKVEYQIEFDKKNICEMSLNLVDKNNQIIEIVYDCSYIEKNEKVSNLFKEVNINIANNDIEACLLPELYSELDKFSYDVKKDKKYIDLVDKRKLNTDKNTTEEQLEVYMKEENEKLQELKENNKGKKIAIIEKIDNITTEDNNNIKKKKICSKPYYCSKVSIDKDGNIFCYSLKKLRYFSELYKFKQFGVGTKERIKEEKISNAEIKNLIKSANKGNNVAQYSLFEKYLKGSDIEKNVVNAYKFLVLSAINKNVDAQYKLAKVYADTTSPLAQDFIDNSIVIPNSGLIERTLNKNPFVDKSKIEKEQIAFYWYKKAADNGNGQAVFETANRYKKGIGVEKNADLAKKYYDEASLKYGIPKSKDKTNK